MKHDSTEASGEPERDAVLLPLIPPREERVGERRARNARAFCLMIVNISMCIGHAQGSVIVIFLLCVYYQRVNVIPRATPPEARRDVSGIARAGIIHGVMETLP